MLLLYIKLLRFFSFLTGVLERVVVITVLDDSIEILCVIDSPRSGNVKIPKSWNSFESKEFFLKRVKLHPYRTYIYKIRIINRVRIAYYY